MDMLMRVKIEGPKTQADCHPRAAVNCVGCQDSSRGDHKINALKHTYFYFSNCIKCLQRENGGIEK